MYGGPGQEHMQRLAPFVAGRGRRGSRQGARDGSTSVNFQSPPINSCCRPLVPRSTNSSSLSFVFWRACRVREDALG